MKSTQQHLLNRRSLVGSALAGAACVATGGAFAGGGKLVKNDQKPVDGDVIGQLTEGSAYAFIGSNFDVWTSEGRARATLRKVESFVLNRKGMQEFPINGFEMAFEVIESAGSLPTGLCHVTHRQLGTFELFFSARSTLNGGQSLGATFSRFA